MFQRTMLNAVKNFPPVLYLRKKRFERYFKTVRGSDLTWGAFDTVEEARRAIPHGRPLGYDNDGCAAMYSNRLDRIFPYDYPVLFWLRPLIVPGVKIFDIGGHVGVHYHAYRNYLSDLENASWTVCEVPTVAARGQELAVERGASNLMFTSDYVDLDGQDVLISAGALQYIEHATVTDMLRATKVRPRHVILNKIPLYDGPDFVTLENTGPSFSPYRNFNRDKFMAEFRDLGYRLTDSWQVPGRHHQLAFHPERSYSYSSGVYFQLN